MKKYIFFIFLGLFLIFGNILGQSQSKQIIVKLNQKYIDYFTRNLNQIKSYHGQTKIYVPIEKTFDKNKRYFMNNGYVIQYEIINKNINLLKIKSKYIVFDFGENKISKNVIENNDVKDFKRAEEKELIEKIKNKKGLKP